MSSLFVGSFFFPYFLGLMAQCEHISLSSQSSSHCICIYLFFFGSDCRCLVSPPTRQWTFSRRHTSFYLCPSCHAKRFFVTSLHFKSFFLAPQARKLLNGHSNTLSNTRYATTTCSFFFLYVYSIFLCCGTLRISMHTCSLIRFCSSVVVFESASVKMSLPLYTVSLFFYYSCALPLPFLFFPRGSYALFVAYPIYIFSFHIL